MTSFLPYVCFSEQFVAFNADRTVQQGAQKRRLLIFGLTGDVFDDIDDQPSSLPADGEMLPDVFQQSFLVHSQLPLGLRSFRFVPFPDVFLVLALRWESHVTSVRKEADVPVTGVIAFGLKLLRSFQPHDHTSINRSISYPTARYQEGLAPCCERYLQG